MKTIADLEKVDFLRQCNKIRMVAADALAELGIMEIRKRMPELTGKETAKEVEAANLAQSKKNIADMLDIMLDKKPEETVKLLECLIIADEGEELDGIDLLTGGIQILCTPKVINFLLGLANMVGQNTAE